MAAKIVDQEQSDKMIEVALPLLDMARATIQRDQSAAGMDAKSYAAGALMMSVQAVVMAEFSQLKAAKNQPFRAVELSADDLDGRFFGIGQAVGMVVGSLFGANASIGGGAIALNAVMRGMAAGLTARSGRKG